MKIDKPIIFFDGICNLCNTSVEFLLKYKSPDKDFYIASLQGKTARSLLPLHYLENLSSVIFFSENGAIYQESRAISESAAYLKKPWNWLSILKYIPEKYLNFVYRFIASKRYKWWGKRASCRLPIEKERHFFLP